jgi:FdhE protein
MNNSFRPICYHSFHSKLLSEETSLENLKKRIEQIKKKRPGYGEILDFYQKVKEAQDKVIGSLKIDPIHLKKEWKELLAKEGFSLLQKQDFPIDIETSVALFETLCQIAKTANPHMAGQVRIIKEVIDNKRIDLKKLLKEGVGEQKIEKIADESGLDKKVFSFLIRNCSKPSIKAGMEQLRGELDPETWLKGYCPMCGSLPSLSLLKEEVGKRYLFCSFCGYQWRIDRLFCPFCENKDQESLHYFYGEGEETHRIDFCDKCHQYIKTIDYRNLQESDPVLEDLATLHLDILAKQKGYKRPTPNPWTT